MHDIQTLEHWRTHRKRARSLNMKVCQRTKAWKQHMAWAVATAFNDICSLWQLRRMVRKVTCIYHALYIVVDDKLCRLG